MSVDRKDDGFLDRWSKRKQAVQDEVLDAVEPETDAPALEPEPESDEEAIEVLRGRDPELAEKVSAIDIDTLTYDDDFSIFMNDKVPEFLRRKALSKLWLSSPILANVDGLNDYDDDFTDAGALIEAAQNALSRKERETAEQDTEVEEATAEVEDDVPGEEPEIAQVVEEDPESDTEPDEEVADPQKV